MLCLTRCQFVHQMSDLTLLPIEDQFKFAVQVCLYLCLAKIEVCMGAETNGYLFFQACTLLKFLESHLPFLN